MCPDHHQLGDLFFFAQGFEYAVNPGCSGKIAFVLGEWAGHQKKGKYHQQLSLHKSKLKQFNWVEEGEVLKREKLLAVG
jgi:hypothetical protein